MNALSRCTGPFIDDVAPPSQKTLWFGILYLFPTVGIAGGYIFGGVIGASMGWRMPFLIQVSSVALALMKVGFGWDQSKLGCSHGMHFTVHT